MKGRVNGVRTTPQAYSEAGDVFRAGGAQMSPVPDDALMTVLPEARR